jgi:hypothetical protein
MAISVPAGQPVEVNDLRTAGSYTALPGSYVYVKLVEWVQANRRGWSRYYATPANMGIIVRSGPLHLQFMSRSALLTTTDGLFEKPVEEKEYAFLRPGNRT